MIFCHPHARFFYREVRVDIPPSVSSSSSMVDEQGAAFHISSFFIGLSFCDRNFKSADVTPSVMDFIHRVNLYDGKREFMDVAVWVSGLCQYVTFCFFFT